MKVFEPSLLNSRKPRRAVLLMLLMALNLSLTGCTAVLSPIDSIPAERLPPQFLAEPQANKVNTDVSRLRQPKAENYLLDEGDVLGVYIEGILGEVDSAPPVQFPDETSDLKPSIGYPIPVREDGTVSLPQVRPLAVRGLNVQQAEQLVRRAYLDGDQPLLQDSNRIIVTLMRKRTYRVFVIRQDNAAVGSAARGPGQAVTARSDESSRGFVLQLKAGENDLLNALAQTGGLPGVNAKSDVRILRGNRADFERRNSEIKEFYRSNSSSDFPYGIIPTVTDEASSITIPLRHDPGKVPQFRPEDIILRDGDTVYVDNRDTEMYYTGGLLRGGEFPLPRDYDLDVLGAVALAGSSIGAGEGVGGFQGGFRNIQGAPPTELIILRQLPGNQQIAVRVDLTDAINDPKARLLVKPRDTLILRYKPAEELTNFGLSTFFTYGIRQLFN
jgi:protein involved in polysaccharide export with SLBB domain